jgi:hypothetical protein
MNKNKAPIILNCFSRGGSNILWNIFLSHPDVCSPMQETLEIFRLNLRKDPKWEGFRFVLMSGQPSFFNQWHLKERKALSQKSSQFVDQVLFEMKMKTLEDEEMKFKQEEILYSEEEVKQSRLVLKNNNGLAYLSDPFRALYPESVFFSLVRNPVSLYEGHKRRGLVKNVQQFSDFYNNLCGKMLQDASKMEGYHIVKFESIIIDPEIIIPDLYKKANLDISQVPQFRFKAKKFINSDGEHKTKFELRKHYWFKLEDLGEILEPNVNEYQTQLLSEQEIQEVKSRTAFVASQLGY